jgi:hypothetical protein
MNHEETIHTFKNLIIDIYDAMNNSYSQLINICYKTNDYREIITLLQEYAKNRKFDWCMILYLFHGELSFHPVFRVNIQHLGLFSIKNLIEKSREILNKQLSVDDFIYILNHKEEQNKKLQGKIDVYENMMKLQYNTINDLIRTPSVSPQNKLIEPLYTCDSPTSNLSLSPSSIEYNPFANNIWK